MANKVPLIINTTSNTIEELPSGDNLDLSGSNISSVGDIAAGNSVSANYFVGTLYGTANNAIVANTANTAGTVTSNAQPNITSVGNLTQLTSTGNINFTNSSNVSLGEIANVKMTGGNVNQVIQTDGSGNLSFTSVASYMLAPVRVATTSNITLSGSQSIDGITVGDGDRVLVWRQTNNTENGIYLVSIGSWTRTNDFNTNAITLSGGVTVTATSGTNLAGVTFVCTNTSAITVGSTNITFERLTNTGFFSFNTGPFQSKATANASGGTAIGHGAAAALDGTAVGYEAQATGVGSSTAYGYGATATGSQSIALGRSANAAATDTVAVGRSASAIATGATSVGRAAGSALGTFGTALGFQAAGGSGSGNFTIAIGANAGFTGQGANSIAIGASAGRTNQANNSIILNATGANLDQTTANTFTVRPVRAVTDVTGLKQLYYDPSTGEIVFYNV